MALRECKGCSLNWDRKQGEGLRLCPMCEYHSGWCSGCEASAPRTEFASNPGRRNGLNNYCIGCDRQRRVEMIYGISTNEYSEMYRSQSGLCAICENHPPSGRLVVDHCHDSGEVRGLLCDGCNTAIGSLMDSPAVAFRAAEYLVKHKQVAVSNAA